MALLCFPFGAYAQNQQVWACQEEASVGLFWENNRWVTSGVVPENMLMTLPTLPPRVLPDEITNNRSNGTYKLGSRPDRPMFCRTNLDMSVTCVNNTGSMLFMLNRQTGRLGYSALLGATLDYDVRDTVLTRIYNCTKF